MDFMYSNRSDIDKYFNHTYVKFREFGDRLFLITGVSKTCVYGIDENDNEFELFLADEFPYKVDYILPHRALFQFKDRAIMLQRIPARQYKRGLCNENTQFIDVSTGTSLDFGFPLLKAFVTKQNYFAFDEALKAKKGACALSSRFSYTPKNGILRLDTIPIGEYSNASKTLYVRRLFIDDLRDLLSNSDSKVPVKELK